MARFSRIEVALKMQATGLVPVFYDAQAEVARQAALACYAGGVRVFEFTNRGDFAHEVFGELCKRAAAEAPELILGVGSVIDAATAQLYMQLGANFVVSPILKEEIARACNRRKVAWIPGCGSLNDIHRAEEMGAEIVKLFPGTAAGGPDFVAAVRGPCPWTSIMPTGGVLPTRENLRLWFEAGAVCVGMGSNLFPREAILAGEWGKVTDLCSGVLQIIREMRLY